MIKIKFCFIIFIFFSFQASAEKSSSLRLEGRIYASLSVSVDSLSQVRILSNTPYKKRMKEWSSLKAKQNNQVFRNRTYKVLEVEVN